MTIYVYFKVIPILFILILKLTMKDLRICFLTMTINLPVPTQKERNGTDGVTLSSGRWEKQFQLTAAGGMPDCSHALHDTTTIPLLTVMLSGRITTLSTYNYSPGPFSRHCA